MAAGLGTRLRPFTNIQTKALLPLLGVPIAQFALDTLREAGVKRVVANVHHLADQAASGLRALDTSGLVLQVSDERAELLGSAGGPRQARELLGAGPFLLLNSDVLCDVDLRRLVNRHRLLRARHGVSLTLCIFGRSPPPGKYTEIVVDDASGLIRRLGESKVETPFFVGAAVLEPEALAKVPPRGPAEFVPTVLLPAIHDGKAGAYVTEGEWYDIGSPELWLKTHLSLIHALETGRLSSRWRKRIESVSRRHASEIWIARDAPWGFDSSQWVGPAYWDGRVRAPRKLGPRAVLYGDVPQGGGFGIGYAAEWVAQPS